jgi:hypothetical protein
MRLRTLTLAVTALLPLSAMAAQPQEEIKPQPHARSHNRHAGKRIMLENAEGASITLWKPDLTTLPLKLSQGGFALPGTGMDNYHAIVVERTWGNSRESLIRYEYLFGRPSKHSPRELTGAVKTDLEIAPDPIPREHYRYHSDQAWGFLLRLHGLPVAGVPLTLSTDNGTTLEAVSDDSGRAVFRLPDDFPDLMAGARDTRSAGFSVSARKHEAGIDYRTTLAADYRINPAHWQSTPLGLLAAGFGVLAGGLLGRVKPKEGKRI